MTVKKTASLTNIQKDIELILRGWTNGSKHVISHYLSPIEAQEIATFTGTDKELLEWVKNFPFKVGAIYVVSDHDLVYDMQDMRPELVFCHIKVISDPSYNHLNILLENK